METRTNHGTILKEAALSYQESRHVLSVASQPVNLQVMDVLQNPIGIRALMGVTQLQSLNVLDLSCRSLTRITARIINPATLLKDNNHNQIIVTPVRAIIRVK